MARRADHTREELKEMAVDAGFKLLKANGFAQFSARKVAARIGYTVGTVYNVFGSHDNLLLHIHAKTLDDWYAFMQASLKKRKAGDPMHILARAYIDYSRKHPNTWAALFEHRMEEGSVLPQWYQEKLARFFTLVEDTLLPRFSGDRKQAAQAARVLWAGIHGIAVLALTRKLDLAVTARPEVLAASLVENYLKGLQHAA